MTTRYVFAVGQLEQVLDPTQMDNLMLSQEAKADIVLAGRRHQFFYHQSSTTSCLEVKVADFVTRKKVHSLLYTALYFLPLSFQIIQWGPVIPQLVKSRVWLSRRAWWICGCLTQTSWGLQAFISRCKQSWQDLRIQTNWHQITISCWKRGLQSILMGNILELTTKWPSYFSKTWKNWK